MSSLALTRTVGVIGTGNFARALTKRLFYAGYSVILGSRRPQERYLSSIDECLCEVTLTSIEDCLKQTSIIFISIHAENYRDSIGQYISLLEGKTVIDVSNRNHPSKTDSNAEYLNRLLPKSVVVKAFNVISAYSMENESVGGNRQVFIASDDNVARDRVSVITRDMGFTPVDMGLLRSARKIESFPLTLFPDWRGPIAFTVGVFNIWLLYVIFLYFIEKTVYRWDQLFIKVLNKPLCMTAITVLSAVFLASSVAALFQIFYGTKHIRFPNWLDKWLKNRKQLGLIGFTLVVIHVIISVLIMSPTYLSSWYQSTAITVPANHTEDLKFPLKTWMIWKGEAACLFGILAFICLSVVAISTLPSVTNSLNWREWQFVQSKLGHVSLFLSLIHVIIMGAPSWAKGMHILPRSITFFSSLLPCLTLTLRFILSLPCIHNYVKKIRRGWERYSDDCKGQCSGSRTGKPYSPGYVIVPNCSRESSLGGKQEQEECIAMENACGCSSSIV